MHDFIQLDFRPPTMGWTLRLLGRVQTSSKAESGLGELSLAFATKRAIRHRVAYRLSELLHALRDEIAESGEVDSLIATGSVFSPRDERILYDICAAVDALYFESRSTYEIAGHFFRKFAEVILDRRLKEEDLTAVLDAEGVPTDWVEELRTNRILFFHETSPWIAFRVEERDPLTVKLVIMKENLHTFDDESRFVLQDELVRMWEGFEAAMLKIYDWLEAEVVAIEVQEEGSGRSAT